MEKSDKQEKPKHEGFMEIVLQEPLPSYNVARDVAHTYPGMLTVAEQWLREPPDTVLWIFEEHGIEHEQIEEALECLGHYVRLAFDDSYEFEVGKAIADSKFDSLDPKVQAAVLAVIGQIVTCMAGDGIREAYVKGTPLTRTAEEFIRRATMHGKLTTPSLRRIGREITRWFRKIGRKIRSLLPRRPVRP